MRIPASFWINGQLFTGLVDSQACLCVSRGKRVKCLWILVLVCVVLYVVICDKWVRIVVHLGQRLPCSVNDRPAHFMV